jgi:hypothetical protein
VSVCSALCHVCQVTQPDSRLMSRRLNFADFGRPVYSRRRKRDKSDERNRRRQSLARREARVHDVVVSRGFATLQRVEVSVAGLPAASARHQTVLYLRTASGGGTGGTETR